MDNFIDFVKQENENNFQFIKRMVRAKIDGVFTGTYSEWIKCVFGKDHSEDVSRREYYGCKMFVLSIDEDDEEQVESLNLDEKILEELTRRELALDKKRIKLSDEFAYINRMKRDIARTETIGEYATAAATIVNSRLPYIGEPKEISEEEDKYRGVLCLSDWHYGLEVNSVINTFNMDIARERVQKLLDTVAEDIHRYNIQDITVVNLGDIISGIIHTTVRLENRIDVITQTIEASEILAELLHELGKMANITYYSVIGNHGRIFANKNESLDKENFNRMIDYYLAERFKDSGNVRICGNEIDETIMHFAVFNWAFVGVHGHNDSPTKALEDLSSMLHIDYNVCLLGHRHSPALTESHGDLTISNGCLCGTDIYAKNVRKSSLPSQNFIIVSRNNPCELLHVITL